MWFQKTAADGKRQEIIILDSKRSNAINIGLTVLPPPRTIKTAILNFDEYALSKEGIEVILHCFTITFLFANYDNSLEIMKQMMKLLRKATIKLNTYIEVIKLVQCMVAL